MADDLNDLSTFPVFRVGPDWNNSLNSEYEISRKIYKFPGTVEDFLVYDEERPLILELVFYLFTKLEEKEFLDFFEARVGRFEKFWLPAPFNFFFLDEDILVGTNFLKIKQSLFPDRYRGFERLWIELKNGDVISFKITGAAEGPIDTQDTLTVASNFDRNITPDEIAQLSFIYLGRWDTDELTIDYKSDLAGITNMKFVELIKEYP